MDDMINDLTKILKGMRNDLEDESWEYIEVSRSKYETLYFITRLLLDGIEGEHSEHEHEHE